MQLDIFDFIEVEYYTTKKPIRLIELFGGYGSQYMALKRLGANVESYRLVEFDINAVRSFNAVHQTNYGVLDIRNVKGSDLGVVDTHKYEYIMTYSFPCQDLSIAGVGLGMKKGGGTRSGLLWEVERLLSEMVELPQILLLENVVEVKNSNNIDDFNKWLDYLNCLGYRNHIMDLNGLDFNVPQDRVRTFVLSILSDKEYKFPKPLKRTKTLIDVLENKVDIKYHLTPKMFYGTFINHKERIHWLVRSVNRKDYSSTITTKMDRGESQYISVPFELEWSVEQIDNIIDNGGWVRKLTPRECGRLMGVDDSDIDKILSVNTMTNAYKQFGNSIIVDVMVEIFRGVVEWKKE